MWLPVYMCAQSIEFVGMFVLLYLYTWTWYTPRIVVKLLGENHVAIKHTLDTCMHMYSNKNNTFQYHKKKYTSPHPCSSTPHPAHPLPHPPSHIPPHRAPPPPPDSIQSTAALKSSTVASGVIPYATSSPSLYLPVFTNTPRIPHCCAPPTSSRTSSPIMTAWVGGMLRSDRARLKKDWVGLPTTCVCGGGGQRSACDACVACVCVVYVYVQIYDAYLCLFTSRILQCLHKGPRPQQQGPPRVFEKPSLVHGYEWCILIVHQHMQCL